MYAPFAFSTPLTIGSPFNHKEFIEKLKNKNIPMIVFRSKSGGAHAFIFTKTFVPATVMRAKLKIIASAVGFAKAEIFPKQDYIRIDRGDTGSFLNLPYHGNGKTVRYAFDDKGNSLSLQEFLEFYEKKVLEEKELQTLEIKTERNDDDDFKGIPPCLEALLSEGVKLGVSSRGIGSLTQNREGVNIVAAIIFF